MGMKVKLKYHNSSDVAEIILDDSGSVEVNAVELSNPKEGPILFEVLSILIPWMIRNNIKTLELEQD